MSKAARAEATRKARQKDEASGRLPGFYAVEGIQNLVSDTGKAQPAYWDGNMWIILGWDVAVPDGADYRVVGAIDMCAGRREKPSMERDKT